MGIFDELSLGYMALFLTIVHDRYIDPETAFSLLSGYKNSKATTDSVVALKALGLTHKQVAKEVYPHLEGKQLEAACMNLYKDIRRYKTNKDKQINNLKKRIPRGVVRNAVPTGATIKEQLEVRGMKQKELAKIVNRSQTYVSMLLQGKAPLCDEVAKGLEKAFGIPAHFWMNLEKIYRNKLQGA